MSRLSHLVDDQQTENDSARHKNSTNICQIYEKTGACPNDYFPKCCPFKHPIKLMSRCLVFHHLYPNPDYFASFLPKNEQTMIKTRNLQSMIDSFFLDVYAEFKQFGNVQDIVIASNLTEHLYGNVYVRFNEPDEALACHKALQGRFYAGRKVTSSLIFFDKLSSLICVSKQSGKCFHGQCCPYVHPLQISRDVFNQAFPRILLSTPSALLTNTPDDYVSDPNMVV
ncbi:hypothetical protein TVAG_404120 [Trichomonas vaginalis G3]|uniref:Uncharacterized protein n=1 Tax=Trichomonas vaginalis (strain ATCC PRA-98 / G3) TaxID=412133 RepID=A2EGG1_TRIV3|nr:pre-mRNA 3'-splice site binding [Trichomonas vaginalis G3]EAY08244.1 hypothetical protein TVAG_404120 [Trichomonas vaginalis G3]KAI5507518.1 pre-mRNA 3'-splice site binding [Trichomonas vaginalis G3]|eukprot:XP_001320467.1 hypothetical protein [Trichomonas vaginalis G3]